MGMSSGGHIIVVCIVFTCIFTKYTSFCDEHYGNIDTSSNPRTLSTAKSATESTSIIQNSVTTTLNAVTNSDQEWSTKTENGKDKFSRLVNSSSRTKEASVLTRSVRTKTSRKTIHLTTDRFPTISKTNTRTTRLQPTQTSQGITEDPTSKKLSITSKTHPTTTKLQSTQTSQRNIEHPTTKRLPITYKTQSITTHSRRKKLQSTAKPQKITKYVTTYRLNTEGMTEPSKSQILTSASYKHGKKTRLRTEKIIPTRSRTEKKIPTRSRTEKIIPTRSKTEKIIPIIPTRSRTQKIIPTRSRTEKIIPTRSRTEKIIPTRSRTEKIIPTRSKTEKIIPIIPTRSRTEKIIPTRSRTEKIITTRSRTEKIITTTKAKKHNTTAHAKHQLSRSQKYPTTSQVTQTKSSVLKTTKEQHGQTRSRPNYVEVAIVETSTEMPIPGGRFIYQYTVTNIDVIPRTYNVSVEVDNYILNAWVTKPTFLLRPAKSHSGLINVHVDHKARPGLERKVTIRITDEVGRSVKFKKFIVIREDPISTDAKPPEIIILNSITTCKKGSKVKMSCGVGNWTVLFSVQDRESGLSIIDVDDHTISSVWTENYSQTQVIRPINGKISTDCCIKRTVIIVTDNNGNTIRIPLYFPNNSSATITKPLDHRSHAVKFTAVVVSAFACVLFLVVVMTVIIQNWSKLNCIKRRQLGTRSKGIQLKQKTANIV